MNYLIAQSERFCHIQYVFRTVCVYDIYLMSMTLFATSVECPRDSLWGREPQLGKHGGRPYKRMYSAKYEHNYTTLHTNNRHMVNCDKSFVFFFLRFGMISV